MIYWEGKFELKMSDIIPYKVIDNVILIVKLFSNLIAFLL
jgi:hypothetical protein